MIILLWIILAVVPVLLGMGICRCFYGREYRKRCLNGEIYIHGLCGLIGMAEFFYLGAVFLRWTLRRMSFLMCGSIALVCMVSLLWFAAERCKADKFASKQREKERRKHLRLAEPSLNFAQLLTAAFILSVLLQIVTIAAGDVSYKDGDMTIEIVQTFLADNGIYLSNPMTGQPYTGGIPLRLRILCLPGFYASVCKVWGIDAGQFVGQMWPVVMIAAGYMAFADLGKLLFPKDRTARPFLLLCVSILFWLGDYMLAMDGFQLLHCGYRGTAIRNCVLVPFTISMALQKKWLGVVLAVLAEACIVWTLYGMGICFPVAVVMFVVGWFVLHGGKNAGID